MPSAFEIQSWPEPRHHAFLSHVAEDKRRLGEPVRQELMRRNVIPWFDQTEYPTGMEPVFTLQESLLKCLHTDYFVTASNLRQGRGWSVAERTLASRVETHFTCGAHVLHHFQLTLFFTPHGHDATARSVLNPLRQNGATTDLRVGTQDSIKWAADQIENFLIFQQQFRIGTLAKLRHYPTLQSHVNNYEGLYRWLKASKVLPI